LFDLQNQTKLRLLRQYMISYRKSSCEIEFRGGKMNINYKFIKQGQSYKIPENKNEVVLDVGGVNQGLIFDHHFPNGPKDCASKLVFNNSNRLNGLKENIKEVTIVIHNDPDFDCSCAAWLVKNYLNDIVPEGAKWVIQYASLVDSGKLKINNEYFLVPSTAIYAFYELAQKKIENNEINADDKNKWILDRAFDLLDWCAENLSGIEINDYKNIDDKSIFDLMTEAHIFNMEFELLKNDWATYENELLDKNICESIKDFKLYNQEKSIEGVKALIFYRQPKSSLTKYWARNDSYIFTLIPLTCDGQWDNAIWKPSGFSGKPNRVILSVPPDSNYNLQTLAIQLERAECEYEGMILGDAAELKRTRTVVRNGYENERWVTNNDPWYDGSSFNYTIVDAPSSLSFLPTEKIIAVAKSFTEMDVTNVQIKIIYPIILEADKKFRDDSWKCFLNANNCSHKDKSNTWIPITELSYLKGNPVNIYLFDYAKKLLNLEGVTNGATKTGTSWYLNDKKFSIKITENKGIKEYIVVDSNDMEPNTSSYEISNSKMVCFPSKIAFLILSVNIQGINISSDIPGILKGISCNFENDLKAFFDIKQLNIKDPVYLVFAEFNREKFINIGIGHDVFAICSFLDETVPLTDGSNEKTLMENMLLRVNAGTVFGFSRNCSVLASMSSQKSNESQFTIAYRDSLNGQWLYEWILAMHQHWKMVIMKTRLGTSDIYKRGNLSKLRYELVEFTANACFTQVTGDPIGAELYNRWKRLLTLDDLNKEVSTQIESLDENSRSAFQSTFTFISLIFLPLSIILSIQSVFQLNLSDTGIWGKILNLVAVFGISGLLSMLLLLYTSKKRKL